jgi:DNA adenine methylase
VGRLRELGCHALLTNSNHQSVREQYAEYDVMAVKSKRYVSCKSDSRTGEDLIITNAPNESYRVKYVSPLPRQVSLFPPTRYMGSKSRLLPDIMAIVCQMQFDHVIDLFAGSGIVSYLFKACGKRVVSNDYMHMSATVVKALIENNKVTLSASDVKRLLTGTSEDHFVEETFRGLYFSDDDNRLIDLLRSNIKRLRDDYKRALAMSALMRACMKRRARGIFTYVGQRYDDGRRDLSLPLSQHFCEAVETLNKAVFDNGISNQALLGDAMHVEPHGAGLVYLDPPYYSLYSDNEYVRRYHFVEGLARDWQGVRIQANTKTKKFLSYPSPFASRRGAAQAFDSLFQRHRKAMLLVSYSSNSLPTQEEMIGLMRKYKKSVRVVPVAYKYSFGNQGWTAGRNRNAVQEYLFVGE